MRSLSDLNPIIPGFAPDPSVVLVDDTYYLVNSTFHLFPGLPIYTSQDLAHWHQIGNAINRTEQLSLARSCTDINNFDNGDHMYATGGLYAPTIRFNNGTFYVVCTNVVRKEDSDDELQNFIVSSKNIHAGEWTDPVYFAFYGIDPSLFFDSDGKAFICGSKSPGPSTKIMLFEIDVETGAKLTEEQELWNGTGGIYPEGPHIYLKDGFYYLMIAEGGTHEGHTVVMARSKNLTGPYEASPENPILSAAGTNEYVQCTGHCEAFEDKNGEWWGVCLGIRMSAELLYGLGRETFLVKGRWTTEGWLEFDKARVDLVVPDVQIRQHDRLTAAPNVDLLHIHDPDLPRYNISNGIFQLSPVQDDLSSPSASPTFIGRRQRKLDGRMSVTLADIRRGKSGSSVEDLKAGLAVYKDEHRFLRVYYSASNHAVFFYVLNKAKGIARGAKRLLQGSFAPIKFAIEHTETEYRIYASNAGDESMSQVGTVETMELSGKDFVGPIAGLFAHTTQDTESVATFKDWQS